MTLKEFLNTATFENKKAVTWNVQGKKAVRHNINMAKLTDYIYVGEIDKTDNYYYINCRLYAFYNAVGFDIGYIDSEVEMNDLMTRINNSCFKNPDAFIADIHNRIDNGLWINLLEIEYIKTVHPELVTDIENARQSWRDRLEAKRNAEHNERVLKKMEEMKNTNARSYEVIDNAISIIKNGGIVENVEITIYSDIDNCKTYSVISYLFDKYNITMPIRTKGFVINRLASITVSADGNGVTYSYYRKNNSKGSNTLYGFIYKLISAIREEKEN